MIKRIFREIKLSQKRNPIKAVLIALILIVSSNVIFSALILNKSLSEGVDLMNDYTYRTAYIDYKDDVQLNDSILSKRTGSPFLYQYEVNNLIKDDVKPWSEGFGQISGLLLQTLREEDPAFDEAKYLKGVESLNLNEDLDNLEVKTNYGNKYLSFDYVNHYKQDFSLPEELRIVEGKSLNNQHNLHILISSEMAHQSDLSVGDIIDVSYDVDLVPFEIVGIFETTEAINNDVMIAAGGAKEIYDTVTSVGSQYNVSFNTMFSFDEDVRQYIESMNEYVETVSDDLILNLAIERYSGFIRSLEFIKTATLVTIFATIIIAMTLIYMIIVSDIKQYQKDAFISIYDDDKKVVSRSNHMLVLMISIFTIGISIFTAPAMNKMLATNIVHNNIVYYNEMYPGTNLEDYNTEFIFNYKEDKKQLNDNLSPDLNVVSSLDYNPNSRSIILLFIIILFIGIVSVSLGNKQLNKKE